MNTVSESYEQLALPGVPRKRGRPKLPGALTPAERSRRWKAANREKLDALKVTVLRQKAHDLSIQAAARSGSVRPGKAGYSRLRTQLETTLSVLVELRLLDQEHALEYRRQGGIQDLE